MQNSRIGWRKRLAASIACALVAALSFSGMEMTASADEQTDGSQAQGVHAVNNADVPVIEPDSPEAKLYSLPDEAADDDSEDATADDAEEDYDPEDFFADAAPLAVNGQDRSAGDVVGPSNHSREDGLWTLSVAGEVTHVTYKNGRYVPDASRDIPFWTRSCTPNYGISGGFSGEGFGNKNRGIFDGLAVSSADKGASTMYAVHSYSNTTTPYKVEEANSGIALYRYREGYGWNTWRITGSKGRWKITEQPVRWNGSCAQGSSSISASYNPSTSTPNSSKNSERNYTFDSARTNFSGGAIINAGTSQEAYIFGGTDSTQFQGSNLGGRHGMKIFSFQPGNGGGVVKYLGYIPIEAYSTPQSVYSGFTTDAEGNVYAAVGQKWGGNNLNLKVYKLTNVPAEMNNIYGAETGRQFTFGEDGHWGGDYNFNNQVCGALGGTPKWKLNNSNCTGPFQTQYSEKVVETNLTFKEYVDGFTGITIAPDKHVTVGVTLGNSHHGKVVEIDASQQLVDEPTVKYFDAASLSYGEVHQNNGGILDILHTDIEGVLSGKQPEQPQKPRWLTLYKKVEKRNGSDQFQVDLNPLKNHNNQTQYAINHGGAKTSFTSATGTQQIGLRTKLPSGTFEARIGERGFGNNGNGSKINIAAAYNTTLACTDSGNVHVGDPKYDETGKNRYFDIVVDPTATGEISCTLTNTGPTQDVPQPPTPKVDVTVYKKFISFAKNNDTFNVGLNYGGYDYASLTGVQYGPNLNYRMGYAQVTAGDSITVFEKDYDGSVADYDVEIACYRGGRDNHESQPFTTVQPSTQDQGIRQIEVRIPRNNQGSNKVSCFVTNTKKNQPSNKTIKIYKNFDVRAKVTDDFKVGFSYGTAQEIAANTHTGVTFNTYPKNTDLTLVKQDIPESQNMINVFEEAKPNSGTDLNLYQKSLTCYDGQDRFDNGRNGTKIYESTSDVTTWNNVDISRATSGTVHCFIDNHRKAGRTLTFKKVFEGTNDTNGFFIRAVSGSGDVQTANHIVGQPFDVASGIEIPDGDYGLNLYEEVETAYSSQINLTNFNISLSCVDSSGNTKTFTGHKTSYQWFTNYGDQIPGNWTGDITCTLTNHLDKPKTKLVTYKKLKRFNENSDQFDVTFVAPGKAASGGDFQASVNTATGTLADTTLDGYSVYEVGNLEYPRTNDSFNFQFQEFARSKAKLTNYTSAVTCKAINDAGVERDLSVSITTDQTASDGSLRNISGSFSGAANAAEVHCYLANIPKSKVNVVLYKQVKRFNSDDQFKVGLYDSQSGEAFAKAPPLDTSTMAPEKLHNIGTPPTDYDQYMVGGHEFTQSENGVKFTVKESAKDSAKISNYKKNLFCQIYNYGEYRWEDFGIQLDNVQNFQNGISVDVKIPAGKTGQVHCYLQNTAMPKVKVVLYKDLKRADSSPTDQFTVGMSKPGATSNTWVAAISPAEATNSNLTETSNYTLADRYSRYQIGTYEYARDDENGFNFKVEETANADDVLDNYTSDLTCKYVTNGNENINALNGRAVVAPDKGRTRSISGVIPAGNNDAVVHCYLSNNPKPKAKVVLYKQVKPFMKDDAFSVGLKTPDDQYNYLIESKKTSDASLTHTKVQLDDSGNVTEYDQYEIGSYKRSLDADFRFRIRESGVNKAKLSNYTPSLICKVVSDTGVEKEISVSQTNVNNDTRFNAWSVDGVIPANQTGEVHCYLRNTPDQLGSITIHKISSASKLDLAGSEWMVQNRTDGYQGLYQDYGKIVDNDTDTPGQLHDADPRPGYIKIDNLPFGTNLEPFSYKVVETAAPAGFTLPDVKNHSYLFDLYAGTGTQDRTRDIENDPAQVPNLPFTGGLGTIPYMLGGLSVLLGAIAVTTLTGGKRRKQN